MLIFASVTAVGAQALSDEAMQQLPLAKMVFPEVYTTIPPTVVRIDGHDVLCYELYIVNALGKAAELSRIEVLDGTHAFLDQSGSPLFAALRHNAKTPPAAGTEGIIAPGEQVVYYAWVEIPQGLKPPTEIRHALTMRQEGGSEVVRIVTEPIAVKPATVVIQPPLRGANWLAGNGPSNTSGHRRTFIPLDGAARISQRFAIDWVQVDKSGKTFSGDAKKNENYICYGQKVHAVANGVVTEVKDGIPQNVPGADSRAVPITLETVGGNHVILDLGNGVYAFYAHLQPGSIRVKVGDRVKVGQVLALLGNSGNSTEPHLHFHLSNRSSPLGSEGLPFAYPSYMLLGKGSLDDDAAKMDWFAQKRLVHDEMPAENEIVQFPDEDE